MKRLLLTFAILSLFFFYAWAESKETEESNWLTNLEEAQQIAKEEELPILIDFTGSDWCGWCFKLVDEIFSQKEFIEYAKENLVLVKLDFPKDIHQTEETKAHNRQIAEKYYIRGFPTIILIDAQGNEIARTGYQYGGAENYIEHLQELLKASKL
jgi:protein disulfide-isomerase